MSDSRNTTQKLVLVAVRVGITLGVAFSSALVAVVVIAITDIYLSGHSLPTLDTALISVPGIGVQMSREDVLLLSVLVCSLVATWLVTGAVGRDPRPARLPRESREAARR